MIYFSSLSPCATLSLKWESSGTFENERYKPDTANADLLKLVQNTESRRQRRVGKATIVNFGSKQTEDFDLDLSNCVDKLGLAKWAFQYFYVAAGHLDELSISSSGELTQTSYAMRSIRLDVRDAGTRTYTRRSTHLQTRVQTALPKQMRARRA